MVQEVRCRAPYKHGFLVLGDNMGHSVNYAKKGEAGKKDMILEFSTRLIEEAMPEEPDYSKALRLSEALEELYSALETCSMGEKAGKSLTYALEIRICKDTVSHQLTRDEDAADRPHSTFPVQGAAMAAMAIETYNKITACIYFVLAWLIPRSCLRGWSATTFLQGSRTS